MAYTTIDKPTDYFNTVTYSGNGSATQAITGVGHQPDWVWIKSRSNTENHMLSDVVRGSTKRLRSDTTNVEDDLGLNGIQSFNADGFTAGDGDAMNASGQTYVAWNWKAGGTASSNTDGSITSTVSANTTSGFSIVSYTGSNSNSTIGHGLGAVPKMIIIKIRSSGYEWCVYHEALAANKNLYLNTTAAAAESDVGDVWNSVAPTTTTFGVGGNKIYSNYQSENYIAYCFAEKQGYSKIGSYTGNGSTDGAFVYTGFKPAWVMIKRTGSAQSWVMFDNKRNPFNLTDNILFAQSSSAEQVDTTPNIDIVSNGWKIRHTDDSINGSESYIYMAFAESPFTTSTGIPTTAR